MTREEEAVQEPQDVEVAVELAGSNNDSNQPETDEDLTQQQGQCALLLMFRDSLQRLSTPSPGSSIHFLNPKPQTLNPKPNSQSQISKLSLTAFSRRQH
jgi:hypothetical protein